MTDWAKLDIQKLLKDRCISIFRKALYMSKRLTDNISYNVKNMAYSIHNAYYLKQSDITNDADYIKQIYVLEPTTCSHPRGR
jgi:hypothetical protein